MNAVTAAVTAHKRQKPAVFVSSGEFVFTLAWKYSLSGEVQLETSTVFGF